MTARPVNVALATSQNGFRLQAFEALDGLGVRVYPLAGDMPEPDILVFPAGTSKVFTESVAASAQMRQALRQRVADGRTRIVIDASSEGAEHHPSRARLTHDIVRNLGGRLADATYLTQELNYPAEYRAWCAEQGLGETLRVVHHDAWIWRYLQQFEHTGRDELQRRLKLFRKRPATRKKLLVSLNYTPRPHKIIFLLSLIRDGLWYRSYVSFGGLERYQRSLNLDEAGLVAHLAALPGFEDFAPEPLHLRMLRDYGRRTLDPPGGHDQAHVDEALPQYAQSWLAVVSETEMHPRPSRITEKAMRPLANLQPFLALGNPHVLKAIRALGFETFPEIFDESYDDVLDPRARFDQVYDQVLRLGRADQAELHRMEARVADKLIHNAGWALTRMPGALREQAFRNLLERILTSAG